MKQFIENVITTLQIVIHAYPKMNAYLVNLNMVYISQKQNV